MSTIFGWLVVVWGIQNANAQAINTQIYVQLLHISWVRDFEYLLRVLVFTSYTFAYYLKNKKKKKWNYQNTRCKVVGLFGMKNASLHSCLWWWLRFIYLFFLNRYAIVVDSRSANNRSSHASSVEHIFTLSRTWASGSWTCYKIGVFFFYWMGKEMKEILNGIMGSLRPKIR